MGVRAGGLLLLPVMVVVTMHTCILVCTLQFGAKVCVSTPRSRACGTGMGVTADGLLLLLP